VERSASRFGDTDDASWVLMTLQCHIFAISPKPLAPPSRPPGHTPRSAP
jgi:hypothetical protein